MRSRVSWALAGTFLAVTALSTAQVGQKQRCEFNIVGTWEAASRATGNQARYRFLPNDTVTTFTLQKTGDRSAWVAGDVFKYKLDNPAAPKLVEFFSPEDDSDPRGSMTISTFDDAGFTTVEQESESTRWTKVDPHRYFLVFGARRGTLAAGGSSFAMLLKMDDQHIDTDAFGSYLVKDQSIVAPIPDEIVKQFMKDPAAESDTMLRIHLTPAEYDRSLQVLRSWVRRSDERKLLYDVSYLNNIVFLEEMAKSVNICSEKLQLYPLNWTVGDDIIAKRNLPQVGFFYIQELRRRNAALHVKDSQFMEYRQALSRPPGP